MARSPLHKGHTLAYLSSLSDTELRVEMALAAGYRWQQFVDAKHPFLEHPGKPHRAYTGPRMEVVVGSTWPSKSWLDDWGVPDFPNDLNAVAEYEEVFLTNKSPEVRGRLRAYQKFLRLLTPDRRDWIGLATAQKRCIAFIMTMQEFRKAS